MTSYLNIMSGFLKPSMNTNILKIPAFFNWANKVTQDPSASAHAPLPDSIVILVIPQCVGSAVYN